jgi:acetyltransferase-like isoleucine patch superfamily enzyme
MGGWMNQHISESAKLGNNTKLGYNVVIMDEVQIGQGCMIGNNVVIYEGTKIGDHVRIDDNTIIGKKPLSSPRSIFKVPNDLAPASIGSFCQIGANVVIYVQCTIGEKNLIADLATIRENVKLGDLNIVGRNVSIENFCTIGDRNKFETNCYITAYSVVEDYCFVAPCVATSNDNYMARDKERFNHFKGITIKRGGRIGVNCTILPGKTIEEDGTVAGGSVVSRDVPKAQIVLGNPAKPFRPVPENQLLENNLDK